MNWYAVGAALVVGFVAGVGFMCWMIIRGHEHAAAAFNTPPKDRS